MEQLSESDLVEVGFSKHLMLGTGFLTTSSMTEAMYYYRNGRITINATTFWTWFLDGEQRNDISVHTKEGLIKLIEKHNTQTKTQN